MMQDEDRSPSSAEGRWLLVKLATWCGTLMLLGWAAWGAAWILANARLSLDMSSRSETSDTLPSRIVLPEPVAAPAPYMSEAGRAITNPSWLQAPEPAFPRAALRKGVETGAVSLECQADAEGRISACEIVDETPPGAGFGAETVRAVMKARIRPRLIDGEPAASQVAFTVRYRLE
jgi:TonB family protein